MQTARGGKCAQPMIYISVMDVSELPNDLIAHNTEMFITRDWAGSLPARWRLAGRREHTGADRCENRQRCFRDEATAGG